MIKSASIAVILFVTAAKNTLLIASATMNFMLPS